MTTRIVVAVRHELVAMKSKPPVVRSRTINRNGYASGRIAIVYGLLMQLATAAAAPLKELSHSHLPRFMHPVDDGPDAEDPSTFLYLGIGVILVLLGGVFAGLTIA